MALNCLFDGLKGIARAGDFAGEYGVQHGKIVEVIASGEDLPGLKVQKSTEFAKRSAFAVAGVGEAEVDGVALVADIGVDSLMLVDPDADAVHFFIAGGDNAEVAIVAVDEFGLAT